jgi:putative tricarboxylic transport membrane protein
MRAADLATAGVLCVLAGIVIFDAVRLGIGWGTDGPNSGFFPFWLALIALVTCVTIGAQARRQRNTRPFVTREQAKPVLQVLVPAIGLVVLMEVLGLYVASALYMAAYMRWIGRHRWITVIVVSVAIPVATFVIFENWFLVPLPKGPLEAWLGF